MVALLRRIGGAIRSVGVGPIALGSIALYFVAVAISLASAHVAVVIDPGSPLARRIVGPVAATLEFIDLHWKALLMLLAPFLLPVVRELLPRLKKAGTFEFETVRIESVAVREKPTRKSLGDAE